VLYPAELRARVAVSNEIPLIAERQDCPRPAASVISASLRFQTCDLKLKGSPLYPTELRARRMNRNRNRPATATPLPPRQLLSTCLIQAAFDPLRTLAGRPPFESLQTIPLLLRSFRSGGHLQCTSICPNRYMVGEL
jgi:hypothetical protein